MVSSSPKFERRERALEAARRRLRRLEIETHRIKAELARLEAEYEDDVADQLSRTLRRRRTLPDGSRIDEPHVREAAPFSSTAIAFDPTQLPNEIREPLAAPATVASKSLARSSPRGHSTSRVSITSAPTSSPEAPCTASDAVAVSIAVPTPGRRATSLLNPTTRPIALSLALHVVGLALCTVFGFATLIQQSVPLFASPTAPPDDVRAELAEVEIPPTKFADAELQNVVSEADAFNLADVASPEMESARPGAGLQPLGDLGQLDALPSDLGSLMAGAGDPGKGPRGGELGEAVFFGARSQGSRFVFVVDNSSSMKGGRLEHATIELLRTVESLTPRQTFYVIFVSDQTYPMFYPQVATDLVPATAPNRTRLAQWLPNAMLASGKNRELIKAMDLAASLRPDVVYLLWDGDLRYSERVRAEVMLHLTQPNPWRFPIHTLGMGVVSLDAEQNLAAIAAAHGGMYRRVDVPAPRDR